MSEPLKPRIDFDGPLQAEKPPLKRARAFDRREADNFAPALLVTGEEEEGAAEAVVESVLRPKRSLWRRMVSAGTAIFGVSVVAQGCNGPPTHGRRRTGLRWAAALPGR